LRKNKDVEDFQENGDTLIPFQEVFAETKVSGDFSVKFAETKYSEFLGRFTVPRNLAFSRVFVSTIDATKQSSGHLAKCRQANASGP
jgi:hypothetical protein